MPRSMQTAQQKGVALLATIILMLAIVLTLSSIFYRHQVDVARLTRMLHGDQALLLGLSAEAWASQTLFEDDSSVDSLDEEWAVAIPLLPVDGGFIRACMVDLQSRINLNSFSSYDASSWSAEMNSDSNGLAKTWLNFLARAEFPADESMAVSIIDWVDSGSEPLNQWGAEQNNYDSNRAGLMVANDFITEVGELAVIQGYDIAMLQKLDPWLVALPKVTKININTASEEVLVALGGANAQNFTEYVLSARPFFSVSDFQTGVAGFLSLSLAETILQWPEELVTVKSNFFQLNMHVTLGEAQLEIHSIMNRGSRDVPVVIRRSVSIIPNILPDPERAALADIEDLSQEGFCQYSSG